MPASLLKNVEIMMAYSIPEAEAHNVEKALANCGEKVYEKIDTGNGLISIFSVRMIPNSLHVGELRVA